MNKIYKHAIIIGRFQLLHAGHEALFECANRLANHTIVMLGSAYQPRTPKNPFHAYERQAMINSVFPEMDLSFCSIKDYHYSDQTWLDNIISCVEDYSYPDTKLEDIVFIYHNKDTYYKDMLPWHEREIDNLGGLNSTDLRHTWYKSGKEFLNVHTKIYAMITDWERRNYKEFVYLQEAYEFEKTYDASAYPRNDQTADAVVVQNGKILLIKRMNHPGKGLWALPGGFVKPTETVLEASHRELEEETTIDVPRKTLEYAVRDKQGVRFDHPNRDPRGRIITTAFLYELPKHNQTKVRASSDAEEAKWFTRSEIHFDMTEYMFSDHSEIIHRMTAGL